jgi:hypothetical protein
MDIEAMINVRNRVNPNDAVASDKLYKAGDVIEWRNVAEGREWSSTELNASAFRIVRVTGISEAQAKFLASRDPLATPEDVHTRRRSVYIDPSLGPAGFEVWWNDDSRVESIREITVSEAVGMVKAKAAP